MPRFMKKTDLDAPFVEPVAMPSPSEKPNEGSTDELYVLCRCGREFLAVNGNILAVRAALEAHEAECEAVAQWRKGGLVNVRTSSG